MFEYKINYFYVFSDELLVDNIGIAPSKKGYAVIGTEKRDNPMFMGCLVNEMGYDYCHIFQCDETVLAECDEKGEYLDMGDMQMVDVKKLSKHITTFGGLVSNVGL